MKKRAFAIAVCIVAALPLAAAASVESILNQAVARQFAPSVSIAVVEHGAIAYDGTRGSAGLDPAVPATAATRYPIGAIGTLFSAVAVVQLAQRKKLSLDEPLAHYLSHAGGTKLRALLAPRPGDANYDDLGRVVERISGLPLTTYLERNVFLPAGMTQTTFGIPVAPVVVAAGFYEFRGTFGRAQTDAAAKRRCCGFLSTARDLAAFDAALLNGKLLSKSAFADLRPAFWSFRRAGIDVLGREGALSGFEANDAIVVKDRFAIVVLANSAAFPAPTVLEPILESFYPAVFPAKDPIETQAEPYPAIASLLRGKLNQPPQTLGVVRTLTFLNSSNSAGSIEYRYLVDFEKGTRLALLVTDANGKVDGVWIK